MRNNDDFESAEMNRLMWLFACLAVVVLLALVMCAPRVQGACTPLPTCWDVAWASPCATPTPTIKWDAVGGLPEVVGYRLYEDINGVLVLRASFPREGIYDEDGLFCGWFQRGVNADVALPRYVDYELADTKWCVKAYTLAGNESVACSAPVNVCMPPVWQPGEVYQ